MKLWQRYLFSEIFKVFFFFLFTFFFLYSILEYSTHMDDFFNESKFQFAEVLIYYWNHFLKRADLLLPLALLISTIKVLTALNSRREWTVLQVAGLKTRQLLKPFFAVALLSCLFNFLNFEFLLPKALSQIDQFRAAHFKHSHRAQREKLLHLLLLKDNSKLIYQFYDSSKDALFDVLWIRSPDDLWRMKFLSSNPTQPTAQYVDHLIRNEEGFLEKAESYDIYHFKELTWSPSMTGKSFIPFENRSIKELYTLAFHTQTTTSYEFPKIVTQLCFKCTIPFIAFIVILATAPACLKFSRQFNFFLIYAISLFGLLSCYMIMDALVTLGENNVISPLIATFTPLVLLGTFFTWKFSRET